jgi:hypothetical protein
MGLIPTDTGRQPENMNKLSADSLEDDFVPDNSRSEKKARKEATKPVPKVKLMSPEHIARLWI